MQFHSITCTIDFSSLHCSKLPLENSWTYTGCTRCCKLTCPALFPVIHSLFICKVSECLRHLFSVQILLILGLIFIAFGVTGISLQWSQEWPTVPLSLEVQSHFEHFFNGWNPSKVSWVYLCFWRALCVLSWQATAPFLQFGAVGALTLLSPFVFQRFHRAKTGMCLAWLLST